MFLRRTATGLDERGEAIRTAGARLVAAIAGKVEKRMTGKSVLLVFVLAAAVEARQLMEYGEDGVARAVPGEIVYSVQL